MDKRNKFRIKKLFDNFDILLFYTFLLTLSISFATSIIYFAYAKRQYELRGDILDLKLIDYVTVLDVSYEKVINNSNCEVDVESRRILTVEDDRGKRWVLPQSLGTVPVPVKGEKWTIKPDSYGGFDLDRRIESKKMKAFDRGDWNTIGGF